MRMSEEEPTRTVTITRKTVRIMRMSEEEPNQEEIPKSKKPIVLTIFGWVVVAALLALPFVAGQPEGQVLPDWVRFVGHFHPVLLHLPIGVFMLILIQEGWRMFRMKKPGTEGDSMFPLFFGVASAILAVLAGFLLYQGHADDYAGQNLAERHLWGGLVFAALSVLVFVSKAWAVASRSGGWLYRGLLFGSVGIMGFASHDGASMTHGEDYLTIYAPDPIRELLKLPPKKDKSDEKVEDPEVYADIVAPILEKRCVQCHKPGKVKGKLRMDTCEMLLKGGSEGPAIVAGDVEESLILYRINLPEDDDEHMPPEGKTDIKPHELVILKWWVENGADPVKTLSQLPIADEVREALVELGTAVEVQSGGGETAAIEAGASEDLKEAVAGFAAEFPGSVTFESQGSDAVTFTSVSLRGKLDDAMFVKIKPILPNLVEVDLSATKITNESVAMLKSATRLRKLRLAETAITDDALDFIKSLPELESLNVYGTEITDAGVDKIKGMQTLRKLYLWRTSVSEEMIETLRKEMPECEIVTGV